MFRRTYKLPNGASVNSSTATDNSRAVRADEIGDDSGDVVMKGRGGGGVGRAQSTNYNDTDLIVSDLVHPNIRSFVLGVEKSRIFVRSILLSQLRRQVACAVLTYLLHLPVLPKRKSEETFTAFYTFGTPLDSPEWSCSPIYYITYVENFRWILTADTILLGTVAVFNEMMHFSARNLSDVRYI